MRRDEAWLLDMPLAPRDAISFVSGLSLTQFKESRLHQNAVIKAIETIGEAAGRVSDETRALHSGIPWEQIVGIRNRHAHGYFEIDLQKVWDTVHQDLPRLIGVLEPLVPPEEP